MARPLCIDLYCGLGGWAEGFLAEGFDVIGFDIERHDYGTGGYPGQLILQDIRTLHGSQFKDATCIVASPPCTEYSYMAMPWSRGKQIQAALLGQGQFPEPYGGSRTVADLSALFDTCFRIQNEVCEAAGRHIPMVVENVRGAIPWVGRSRWHYGSFHLWGDVPALMPITLRLVLKQGVAHRSNSTSCKILPALIAGGYGLKLPGNNGPRRWEDGDVQRLSESDGVKQHGSGAAWFDGEIQKSSSRSSSRKAASAQIAKIPFPLARHIARCFSNSSSLLQEA